MHNGKELYTCVMVNLVALETFAFPTGHFDLGSRSYPHHRRLHWKRQLAIGDFPVFSARLALLIRITVMWPLALYGVSRGSSMYVRDCSCGGNGLLVLDSLAVSHVIRCAREGQVCLQLQFLRKVCVYTNTATRQSRINGSFLSFCHVLTE